MNCSLTTNNYNDPNISYTSKNKLFCLNSEYSTTRRLTKSKPDYLPDISAQPNQRGGIRTLGYYKQSHWLVEGNISSSPLISVITVVYNGQEFLENAIRSVIYQNYDNVEYIIIDGASSDDTLEIIYKYDRAIDYWISEPDNGIYDAMNKGIKSALGDWIIFLGNDDILLDCLQDFSSILQDKNTLYYGDVYRTKKHKIYDGKFDFSKLVVQNICHQSIFYPKIIFEDNFFDLRFKYLADYYFNLQAYLNSQFEFVYIPKLVAIYSDEGSSSIEQDREFIKIRKQIILQTKPWILFHPRILLKAIQKIYLIFADKLPFNFS